MKTWIIKSGDDQWVAEAETPFGAAVIALKNRLPEGLIAKVMTVREPHVEDMSDDCWLISTKKALKAAGFGFRDHSQLGESRE